MQAFHVDRLGNLQAGMTIETQKVVPFNPDTGGHINELVFIDNAFPDGLTPFGQGYLLEQTVIGADGNPSRVIELLYEVVRATSFPEKPSRYASVFASSTIDEARAFRLQRGREHHPIWVVEADDDAPFIGDQNLFDMSGNALAVWMRAYDYWKGNQSPTPDLELVLRPPVRVIERA